MDYITELVHTKPRTWFHDVEKLHETMLTSDRDALRRAMKRAVDDGTIGVEYVRHRLRMEEALG